MLIFICKPFGQQNSLSTQLKMLAQKHGISLNFVEAINWQDTRISCEHREVVGEPKDQSAFAEQALQIPGVFAVCPECEKHYQAAAVLGNDH